MFNDVPLNREAEQIFKGRVEPANITVGNRIDGVFANAAVKETKFS